jgi:hypothetical protein
VTFTYGGDPAASPLEEIRFLVGDTDSTRPLLSDEEIDYVIAKWDPLYGSTTLNAAVCCEVIAGHYAREISVSADGVSHPLPNPFMVAATQNPVEQEGTYRLPESQLDRFLMRLSLGYPGREAELELMRAEFRSARARVGGGFLAGFLAGGLARLRRGRRSCAV